MSSTTIRRGSNQLGCLLGSLAEMFDLIEMQTAKRAELAALTKRVNAAQDQVERDLRIVEAQLDDPVPANLDGE